MGTRMGTRLGDRSRGALAWIIGLIPAAVLLYAAVLKGLDPLLFADQIMAHKMTPASWSILLAHLFITLEMLLGFALLLRLWPRWTHPAFIALMIGFIGVTAWAWGHGNAKECGCFGRAVGRGPAHVILEDAGLIVLSVIALRLSRRLPTSRWRGTLGLLLVPATIAFTLVGARLPADALVTGIHAGTNLADLPVEDLRRPHAQGWSFLVLVDRACAGCDAGVAGLNELAGARRDIGFAVIYSGSRQEAMAWRLQRLPAFPVAHVSPRVLRAYYRSLPTCFLLNEGRLVRAWWGRIPPASEIRPLLPEPAEPSPPSR